MTFIERLQEDLKDAMRGKEKVRLRTIRSLRAALLEKEIELRTEEETALTDEVALSVVQKQAKKRRDAIEQYQAASRADLAAQEQAELEILEAYLPAQASDEEIRAVIRDVIGSTGASSVADMGKVMGPAMGRLRGKADGRRISDIARELLSE